MGHVAGHCIVGLLQSRFLFWVPLKVGSFLYPLINKPEKYGLPGIVLPFSGVRVKMQ